LSVVVSKAEAIKIVTIAVAFAIFLDKRNFSFSFWFIAKLIKLRKS